MTLPQLSESTEMYLKALAELGDRDVAIARLAGRLGVTHVSANEMMRRLAEQGLVKHTPYKGVTLTKKGREVAANVLRRQRLWEVFLYQHLKIEWAKIYELACSLEHATAPEVTDALADFLGNPTVCPRGNWETGGALVSGFMAKEIVVSTLSQVYVGGEEKPLEEQTTFGEELTVIGRGFAEAAVRSGKILLSILPGVDLVDEEADVEDTLLSAALRERFTPLSAVSLLVFVLLYVPCVATLGAIKHEFGRSWTATSAVYQTAVAWLAAFLIYQGGRLLGLG